MGDIDGEERGRDIAAAAHQRPRGACTEIEIPGGLSDEVLMTTTIRHRAISDLRRAKVAPGPKPAGPPVPATVKWYNPDKGFGFVGLASGGDAFLHVSVVERSGNSTVPPGATLEIRVEAGQKGAQVTEILSVDPSTASQELARRPRPERPQAPPDQAAVEEIGTVKFYAAERGFGFIVRDRGGKDIFVHVSALNCAGISELAEGQRVAVDMVEGARDRRRSAFGRLRWTCFRHRRRRYRRITTASTRRAYGGWLLMRRHLRSKSTSTTWLVSTTGLRKELMKPYAEDLPLSH